jgi:hypothetical protein
MKSKAWVVLLLVLVLVSCTANQVIPEMGDAVGQGIVIERIVDAYYDVYRMVDTRENVVCYMTAGSISCVRREGR